MQYSDLRLGGLETPTKYFFNLEKRHYEEKIISQLYIGEEEPLSDLKKITTEEIENHYSQFYRTNMDPRVENDLQEKFQSFLGNLTFTYFAEQDNRELEAEINFEML